MIIYACKYKLKDDYELFIGTDIKHLLNPVLWNKDQLLEVMMFKMPNGYLLEKDGFNSEKLESLCQKIKP